MPVVVHRVAFCLSHPWCATTSTDGSVAVWDVSTNTCRHILYQDNAVVSVKFLPNLPVSYPHALSPSTHLTGVWVIALCSQVFATASVDATVRVYDSRNGKCAQVFTGHVDSILDMDVAVTKDADDASAASVATILSGGDDNVARVYRFDVEIA